MDEGDLIKRCVNLADVVLIAIDSNDKVIFINNKGCEILGYKKEEIIGKDWFKSFLPKKYRSKTKKFSDNLISKKEKSGGYHENPVLTKGGQEKIIRWKNSLIKDNQGKIVGHLSSGEEVTDLRKREEKMEESEEKFRRIFNNGSDGILGTDLKTKKFVFANPKMCEMTGYSKEEILKLSVDDLHPKEYIGDLIKQISEPNINKIKLGKNIPVLRKDKSVIYCDINPNVFELNNKKTLIGFFRDTTNEKKSKKELENAKEKAEKYLDIAGTMLVALNKNGEVTLINKKGCEILGYKKEEIIGKDWFKNFLPRSDIESVKEIFRKNLTDKKQIIKSHTNPVVNKNGEIKIISWINSHLEDDSGNIIGTLSSGENITEKIKQEKELKEKNEEMEKFNQFVVGRELKMVELKKEVNSLLKRLGKEPKYEL